MYQTRERTEGKVNAHSLILGWNFSKLKRSLYDKTGVSHIEHQNKNKTSKHRFVKRPSCVKWITDSTPIRVNFECNKSKHNFAKRTFHQNQT